MDNKGQHEIVVTQTSSLPTSLVSVRETNPKNKIIIYFRELHMIILSFYAS